ncbi:hypothetical protein HDIA_2834 [Hartmannibacter diazotrophicus]|uniref:Gamma-glutamylcyclotransferase AIG2-like domain-containing protein n=1 Tax=Hartmannibacter diazotrophicus TaxID=1482074 RepID=A0A2C9D9V8_9HYPH|nr:gamma-glutamylcyclotransferase family protein [Hartmannibacter diazotrophicus]SON56375.1 hypothetical protein HDIA_2834 [Hartmannibacter diazotrophicus]
MTRQHKDGAAGDRIVGYVGYGSLVNRETLRTDFVDLVPCRLSGWRRAWRHRILRSSGQTQTVLTAMADAAASIDGVVVLDRLDNLPLVDARERGYDRHPVDRSMLEIDGILPPEIDLYVYVSRSPHLGGPEESHPVPLSYVDVVMAGYVRLFGRAGAQRFVASTDGWDVPRLDDRAAPTYPRAIACDPDLETLVDDLMAAARA